MMDTKQQATSNTPTAIHEDIKALRGALDAQPLTTPNVTFVEKDRLARLLAALERLTDLVNDTSTEAEQAGRPEGELISKSMAALRTALEASRAKCALLAAEVEGLRKDAERLDAFEDWLSDRAGPLLHIEDVRDALSSAAAAPNQGEAG